MPWQTKGSLRRPQTLQKKIMESMGWKDGEGLGAKGDGRKSHIATVKNGPDGVGYGKKNVINHVMNSGGQMFTKKMMARRRRKRKRSISLRRNENKTRWKTRMHRVTCQQKSKS